MSKPISELFDSLSPEDHVIINAKAANILTAIRLSELRKQLGFTQAQVAQAMHIKQPTIAQLEKRGDVQISTLRQYLEILGGELGICAKFPDGSRVSLGI